jgi:hypothetical protein
VHERRSHEDARCFAAVDAVAAAAAEARAQVAGDGASAVPVGTAAAARAVVAPAACVGGGGVVVLVVVRVVGPAAGEQVVDRELDLTATVTLIWRSLVGGDPSQLLIWVPREAIFDHTSSRSRESLAHKHTTAARGETPTTALTVL